jgi:hypothetical protein
MAESLSVIRIRGRGGSNSDRRIGAGGLHKYVRGSVSRFSAGAETPMMLDDAGRWVVR